MAEAHVVSVVDDDSHVGIYQPLRPSQIRLFSLERLNDDTLSCSIQTNTLGDECPSYQALSYTWAQPVKLTEADVVDDAPKLTHAIACKGNRIPMTENTFRACDQLQRDNSPDTLYWVDAICINQLDLSERAEQVQQMSSIFGAAEVSVVWLGWEHPFVEDFKTAIDVILPRIQAFVAENDSRELFSHDVHAPEVRKILDLDNPLEILLNFCRFCATCRWFRRAWVWQEVASARQVSLRCGTHQLSLANAAELCAYMRTGGWETQLRGFSLIYYGNEPGYLGTEITAKVQARLLNEDAEERSRIAAKLGLLFGVEDDDTLSNVVILFWTLLIVQTLSTLIPHDKLYAVLSLVNRWYSDRQFDGLEVDYRRPVESVFQKVAELFLLRFPLLVGLNHVQDPSNRKLANLPSWVGDLTSNVAQTGVLWLSEPDLYEPLIIPELKPAPRRVEGNVFYCTGGQFDLVENVCGAIIDDYGGAIGLRDILELCSTIPANKYEQNRVESTWRTLIADTADEKQPAPSELSSSFWSLALTGGAIEIEPTIAGPKKRYTAGELTETLSKFEHECASGILPTMAEIFQFRDDVLENLRHPTKDMYTAAGKRIMAVDKSLNMFGRLFLHGLSARRLFTTRRGYVGLGPPSVQPGDQVHYICDCRTPMILRPRKEDSLFQLLGECYLHGSMHGEIMEDQAWRESIGEIGIA